MNCFIIMPISTPEEFVIERYSGDKDHFRHVLEHLFLPAISAVGLEPIPPVAQGADIIPAEIIKHLETADLVLCDISSLNPNVFFELGIRTAVNKPIALVKDDVTPRVPFDTAIINNHTYLSSLSVWILNGEIDKLKDHLQKCVERSKSGNTLWKYFSLSTQAEPLEKKHDLEDKIDFLNLQFEALRTEFRGAGRISEGQLVIDFAEYGTQDKKADVTQILRSRISRGKLEIKASNNILGGDPAPGEVKELRVVYFYAGKKYSKSVPEDEILNLP